MGVIGRVWKWMHDNYGAKTGLNALGTLVRPALWRQVSNGTGDFRHLTANLALELNVPEDKVIRALGARLRLPVLNAVEPMSVRALRQGVDLELLRRLGAILCCKDGSVTGIVCVDPGRVRGLSQDYGKLPIMLASWLAIAGALEESARILAREEVLEAQNCRRVLEFIWHQAQSHGAELARVRLADGLFYEFNSSDGCAYRGEISRCMRPALLRLEALSRRTGCFEIENGQVRVTLLTPDSGGEFIVESIGGNDNSSAAMAAEASASQKSDRPLRVVSTTGNLNVPLVAVVDDDPIFCNVLERYLKRALCQVARFSGGQDLLSSLRSGGVRPDLIICDVHMPDGDGFEILRQVKAMTCAFFIMLSADKRSNLRLRALSEGADAFVSKLDDPRILYEQVQRLARSRKAA